MEDEAKFSYFSRTINYCDSAGKLEIEASKIRKLTALNWYESLKLDSDNEAGCEILKTGYKAYASLVDDPKGLNNYSDRVLKLLPNNLAGNQKTWTSSITLDDVCSHLEALPCSANKTDPWEKLNCSNIGPTEKDIETFRIARKNFLEGKPDVPSNSFKETTNQKIAKSFLPKAPTVSEIKSQSVSRPAYGIPSESNINKKFVPNVSTARKRAADDFVPNPADFAEDFTPKFPVQRQPEVDRRFTADREVPKSVKSFKTASDELRLQNLKKYGKQEGRNDGQNGYGAVKKSLGARRGGGIHGKFVPPVLKEDREVAQGANKAYDEDTEIDERLKNIDPKMVELIRNEIMDCGPKLTWDDIAGLEFAKNTIQEIVVWPMLRPDIFTGLRRPPKGILLFGPPGTGKTLIGKCIASQSGASFFSISASSLTSKWVGDGEKMVRALFAVARVDQPSVVFIDEIDSLLSQRSDTEHESSRRLKTEFLVQLDGVGTGDEDRILIIGATNRPQELDEAARRRLVKRLYIPLPDTNARAQMVRNLIAKERHDLTDADITEVAELTEGYSGADVKHVCQEASLGPIRSIPPSQICAITSSQVRPVDVSDFKSALTRVKSTVSPDDLNSYVTWDRQFGCGSI